MNKNGGRAGIELLQLKNATIMLFTVKINHENALHNEDLQSMSSAYYTHKYPYMCYKYTII